MNKIIFVGFFLLFLLNEIHCDDETSMPNKPESPPDVPVPIPPPAADSNGTMPSFIKPLPNGMPLPWKVPNNGNNSVNQPSGEQPAGEPTSSTPAVEAEPPTSATTSQQAPLPGNEPNGNVNEPKAPEGKNTSEVPVPPTPSETTSSAEPMTITKSAEEVSTKTTPSAEEELTTTPAEPVPTSEMPISSTEEEKMTSSMAPEATTMEEMTSSTESMPEERTTTEEMMPSTEPMPEEETTTADSMMNTLRALEFYKNQIPECLFELVQIDMAEDDLNERWGKSFNKSFLMAEEHRKEIIMEYKYSTPPENGREDKYQIDLNNNFDLDKPDLVKPGGEQRLKEKFEQREREKPSVPLKNMLELDGIDYFMAREVRLLKNRYCMVALLTSLRQVQGHPVRVMPIAVSVNKNMTDKIKIFHDFNETDSVNRDDRYAVMLAIAHDEIGFAKQNPPVDSSMALYATYVGADGQNVLVEIQAPRMQMEEMTTASSNEGPNILIHPDE